MSSANLCDIEKGRKGLSLQKAAEIATILGYSPATLVAIAIEDQLDEAGLEFELTLKPAV
jgi:hypothetical protein